jgi:hypothetical protein
VTRRRPSPCAETGVVSDPLGHPETNASVPAPGACIPLPVAQSIAGRHGEVTAIPIELSIGTRPLAMKRLLAERYPGVAIIADGEESIRLGANGDLVSNARW